MLRRLLFLRASFSRIHESEVNIMHRVNYVPLYDGNGIHQRVGARVKENLWSWPIVGGLCGLAGGIVCSLLGGILIAGSWLMSAGNSYLYIHHAGTALLLLTMPLLILGAHCLDLQEGQKS